jgi:hypothetical protein
LPDLDFFRTSTQFLAGSGNSFEHPAPDSWEEVRSEFTKTMHNHPHLERLVSRSIAVLLMIEGKCSLRRAKPAHFVGHLPGVNLLYLRNELFITYQEKVYCFTIDLPFL